MRNAKCNRTGKEVALNQGQLIADMITGKWAFYSFDVGDIPNSYPVDLSDFIKSEVEFIDKLAHLYKKDWFNANLFFDCILELKRSNNILGGI